MVWLGHLLRTGSEPSTLLNIQEESMTVSICGGSLKREAFPQHAWCWQSFPGGICLSLCDSDHASSSSTVVTLVLLQVTSTSCPRFLKIFTVSWQQLLTIQPVICVFRTSPSVGRLRLAGACSAGHPVWSTIRISALEQKKNESAKKHSIIIKIKVLTPVAQVWTFWGRQAQNCDRFCE